MILTSLLQLYKKSIAWLEIFVEFNSWTYRGRGGGGGGEERVPPLDFLKKFIEKILSGYLFISVTVRLSLIHIHAVNLGKSAHA